jgi:hypothetical protein
MGAPKTIWFPRFWAFLEAPFHTSFPRETDFRLLQSLLLKTHSAKG